mmetsp:Transcript_21184/g.49298  ORF Transcript_21184/g.49298 Transcript_21184/m.49298 type:complete len:217 (+) Transcript_21184:180-830(+)
MFPWPMMTSALLSGPPGGRHTCVRNAPSARVASLSTSSPGICNNWSGAGLGTTGMPSASKGDSLLRTLPRTFLKTSAVALASGAGEWKMTFRRIPPSWVCNLCAVISACRTPTAESGSVSPGWQCRTKKRWRVPTFSKLCRSPLPAASAAATSSVTAESSANSSSHSSSHSSESSWLLDAHLKATSINAPELTMVKHATAIVGSQYPFGNFGRKRS